MDFLDSLDLQTNGKKSHRMRSWYLYEQYKSLEKHQLDAAEKLKNRLYQESLLHRELTERRARRRLYEDSGTSLSEPQIVRSLKNLDDACLSTTTENFYESFSEFHNDFQTADDEYLEENISQDESDVDKAYMEDLEGLPDDTSCAESMNSVVEKADEGFDVSFSNKSMTEKLEQVQRNMAESLNMQLEAVKENMICLEQYARLSDEENSSEEGSAKPIRSTSKTDVPEKRSAVFDSNMFTMWSRLVSFAYQVIQLNHGNCYYDYSSQLMTAVLACDVLRRGVNRMCHILQRYVSPIKFADNSEDGSINSYKSVKRKNSHTPKKIRKYSKLKINSSLHSTHPKRRSVGNYCSDNLWQHCSRYSSVRCGGKPWRSSVPCQGEKGRSSKSSGSLWPRELESAGRDCHCYCHKKVVNPMLKLVRYLDHILKSDVDDFVFR